MMVVVIVINIAALVMVFALFVQHAFDTVSRLTCAMIMTDHRNENTAYVHVVAHEGELGVDYPADPSHTRNPNTSTAHAGHGDVSAHAGGGDASAHAGNDDFGALVGNDGIHAHMGTREVNAHVEAHNIDASDGLGDIRYSNPPTGRVRAGDTGTKLSADVRHRVEVVSRGRSEAREHDQCRLLRKLHRHLMRMGLVDPLVRTTSSGDSTGGSTETQSDVDVQTGNASGSTDDDDNNGGDYANKRNTHQRDTEEASAHSSIAAAARAGIQAVVQLALVLRSVPKPMASGLRTANPREHAQTHTPATPHTHAQKDAGEPTHVRRLATSPPTHIRPLVEVHQRRIQEPHPAPTTTNTDVSSSLLQHQAQQQQSHTLASVDALVGSETPPPSQQSPQAHTPTPASAHASAEENLKWHRSHSGSSKPLHRQAHPQLHS